MKRLMPIFSLLLAVGVGCSGEPGSAEDPIDQHSSRFGLISLTYGHDWDENGERMLLTTNAQFVSYTSIHKSHVARLLALPLDPEKDLPGLEQCKVYDLGQQESEINEDEEEPMNVELLEAGDLQIHAEGHDITLAPRHFPGLLPFISGVVYSEAQSTQVEAVGQVIAESEGGEAVGAFAVQLESPVLPRLLQINGIEPSQEIFQPTDDINLKWQTPEQDSSDIIYIELRPQRRKQDLALRCQPRDDGDFEVPAALFAELEGPITLQISRLRQIPFSAAGLDLGELRITARDSLQLQ